MIKHIVLFRFKDKEGKEENVKKLKTMIDDLKHKIPFVAHIEGGINFSTRDAAYDVALVSDFRTHDDLEAYRVHPDHLKLIDFLKTTDYELVVTDYEY
ncbi:MAG TPA: Dabb family protein [Bacteroidales bacterium]|nr:Dabb family protein [Bacteroidales bacterium]